MFNSKYEYKIWRKRGRRRKRRRTRRRKRRWKSDLTLQAEEPGGSESKEGGEDPGPGHGAEGQGSGLRTKCHKIWYFRLYNNISSAHAEYFPFEKCNRNRKNKTKINLLLMLGKPSLPECWSVMDFCHRGGRGGSRPIHSFETLFLWPKVMDILGFRGGSDHFSINLGHFWQNNQLHLVILDVLGKLVFPLFLWPKSKVSQEQGCRKNHKYRDCCPFWAF